jgi:phospholipase/carboxylesterase
MQKAFGMHEHPLTLAGLETIVVEPVARSIANIIILHGYSMSPAALSPFAHSLGLSATFYFPRAPRPVEEGGWTWWNVDKKKRADALAHGPRDLAETSPDRQATREQVLNFVQNVNQRDPQRTVLGGFSQGGMLCLDLLLLEEIRVAATALFSSCLIDQTRWRARVDHLNGLPSFVSHGLQDRDLAFAAGERLRDFLIGARAQVNWVAFDGGHEIPLPVWRAFKQFVNGL